MSNYHTSSLIGADVFLVMGSIYAEVARYDSAIVSGKDQLALQASNRAKEIVDFANISDKLNNAQKREIEVFWREFQKSIGQSAEPAR